MQPHKNNSVLADETVDDRASAVMRLFPLPEDAFPADPNRCAHRADRDDVALELVARSQAVLQLVQEIQIHGIEVPDELIGAAVRTVLGQLQKIEELLQLGRKNPVDDQVAGRTPEAHARPRLTEVDSDRSRGRHHVER
jgi:hypothetical protein